MYTEWYNKYLGVPFKHLGNDIKKGMDCFNLCKYVIEQEANVTIPIKTSDMCNIIDDDWYNKTNENLLLLGAMRKDIGYSWDRIEELNKLDIITMSIGGTNIDNHCALYLGNNKILHNMPNHVSWVAPYGNYYKQYTTGKFRWSFLKS